MREFYDRDGDILSIHHNKGRIALVTTERDGLIAASSLIFNPTQARAVAIAIIETAAEADTALANTEMDIDTGEPA